jgi:hypothetical protein
MKIKVWFFIAAALIITDTVSAEIQVDYTNQFFVSKIDEGYCYVFLYPDDGKITFVKDSERNKTSEKIDINVPAVKNLSNIFIIKNELFIMLADNVFNIYAISELVNGENNAKLGTKGRIGQLKYDSFSLYEDKFFFTKDKKVYEYTGKMQSKLVKNINIESVFDYSFFQYNPISTIRENRYNKLLQDLETDVNNLTNKKNNIKLGEMPSRTGNKPPGVEEIYKKMRTDISKSDNLDSSKYKDIFILASITGKNEQNITAKIGMLNKSLSSIDSAITSYYTQNDRINSLNISDTIASRKDEINTTIQDKGNAMTEKYGIKTEEMDAKYRYYNTLLINDSKWMNDLSKKDDFTEEYNKNKDKTENYHKELLKLYNEIPEESDYFLWRAFNINLQKFIEENTSRIIDSTGIKELYCITGRKIDEIQHTIAKDYIEKRLLKNHKLEEFGNDITVYNNKIKLEKDKLVKVESEWTREHASAEGAKKTAITTISDYCINRYFKEKYDELMKLKNGSNQLPKDHESQYIDFIKMSGAGNTIYGFKDNQTINYQEVRLLETNKGESVRYIRPDSNNLVRFIEDKSVLLFKDTNELVRYDLTLNNIILESIKPVKEIFYILGSGKSYYYVTKDGELYEINSNKAAVSNTISPDDTVLVTTQGGEDTIYILKNDGNIVSNGGNKTEQVLIKPVNSGDIQKIKVRDKKFIF